MKKSLSMFLSLIILLAMLVVPVNFVSAESDDYLTHYVFSFAEDDIYDYQTCSKTSATLMSFVPTGASEAVSIAPLHDVAALGHWESGVVAEYAQIDIDGKATDALHVKSSNDIQLVPIMENGKPFELAPGHTYTVNMKYTHTRAASDDKWYGTDMRGLYVGGGFLAPYLTTDVQRSKAKVSAFGNNYAHRPYAAFVDDLYNIDSTGLISKTVSFATPAASGTGYTYDAQKNAYTTDVTIVSDNSTVSKDFYNYLYLHFEHFASAEINIVYLEIIRDDYVISGTVEYIDQDGSVLKSEEVTGYEYAVNFIPENTPEKYFQGWYLDEALTDKVTSAKVLMKEGGIKLYAKWEEYKKSIECVNPGRYYGVANFPSITAAGVYSSYGTTRSGKSSTTMEIKPNKLTLSAKDWGDGILITAVDDVTGELFRAKPNTAYKVSLKFRITAESIRADGMDVSVAAGAGLPDSNANYPMGKYWDEDRLKSKLSNTIYSDGVTEEGKYVTYTALFTTGEFTTIPAIGVELWLYQDAAVEIYSLNVTEFDGETLAEGEFLVSKEVENRTTYMVKFDYSLIDTPSEDIGIGFKTTAVDTIGYPTYIEGEDIAIYTVSADKTVGQWYTATALLTTDMTATVKNSYGCDDIVTALNTNLYGYVIGDEKNLVSVKNIAVRKLTDLSGNELIDVKGGQCLTNEAEALAGQQALRYSFSYDTVTGNEIIIDGEEYTVKERGFIYANGNKYASGGVYNANFNLTNAKAGQFLYNSKKTNLDICWKHSSIGSTGYSNLIFSTYVKDFESNDTKELMVKAFVVIEIEGQEFTVYSDSVNRSVAYLKSVA